MSNLIRINNKLMTKNNKLLTANSGSSGLTYNNNLLKFNNYVIGSGSTPVPPVDPYNPLGLPANTVRVVTNNNQPPSKYSSTSYETATLVPGTTNTYDVYKSGTNFTNLLSSSNNIVEVLGANTTGITNMNGMFISCSSLTSVALFDTSSVTIMANMFMKSKKLTSVPLFNTSNVTNMYNMFNECVKLVTIPLFNTSKVTNMSGMFAYCYAVESGALALYQQASTQAKPPSNHTDTFDSCGEDTTTGAAELAQIPSDWK